MGLISTYEVATVLPLSIVIARRKLASSLNGRYARQEDNVRVSRRTR
jgi:hypothetical protein